MNEDTPKINYELLLEEYEHKIEELNRQIEELQNRNAAHISKEIAELIGRIAGLEFSIKCNCVSGGEVKETNDD